jgi:hypothetical protein
MEDDFDWNDESVVSIRHQAAIAVFVNTAGDISIRQQRDPICEEHDQIVVVSLDNVSALIKTLRDLIGNES